MKVKRPTHSVDKAEWQRNVNSRLRTEYIAGARGGVAQADRRPMLAEELACVLWRYAGEV